MTKQLGRLVWGGTLLAGVVACASPASMTPPPEAGVALGEQEQDLKRFLILQGYVKVPMARLPTGHFSVAGRAGEVPLDLIVDTGASHTVIDIARAARFELETRHQGSRATGIGVTAQRVESGHLADVAIGSVQLDTLRVTVIDLSHVNQVLRQLGADPVDGIIGGDVLMAQRAVIDYGGLTVFLRQ
jgi:predicted aspartyl protease